MKEDYCLSDSTLNLFSNSDYAEEFWQEVNELAEKHQVPVDYILAEFY